MPRALWPLALGRVEVHWHRSHARSLAPRSRRCSSESMDRPNCLNMQRAGKPALHGVGRAWRGAARRGALPIVRGTAPRQGAVPPERDARARSPARQVEHAPAAPAGDRSVRRWPVSCSRVVCKSAPITSRFIIAPTPAVPIKTQKQKQSQQTTQIPFSQNTKGIICIRQEARCALRRRSQRKRK